jgi:hypothetical protein
LQILLTVLTIALPSIASQARKLITKVNSIAIQITAQCSTATRQCSPTTSTPTIACPCPLLQQPTTTRSSAIPPNPTTIKLVSNAPNPHRFSLKATTTSFAQTITTVHTQTITTKAIITISHHHIEITAIQQMIIHTINRINIARKLTAQRLVE